MSSQFCQQFSKILFLHKVNKQILLGNLLAHFEKSSFEKLSGPN